MGLTFDGDVTGGRLGLLYFIDFISLSNESFKSLTCVGKVQCCLESILFQRLIFISVFRP